MRNYIYSLLLLCSFFIPIYGQNAKIEVSSFQKDELSQAAKITAVTDEYGEVCGLVKVKAVALADLQFTTGKNGQLRPVKVITNKENGFIQLYLSPGTRYLNIISKEGKFNASQYLLPDIIESEMVYTLELTVHSVAGEVVIKKAVLEENFMIMTCSIPLATLSLDGLGTIYPFVNGSIQQSLPYGRYFYTVNEPTGKYRQVYGDFTITKDSIVHLDIQLQPTFGTLHITSIPIGAQVYMHNQLMGNTPLNLTDIPMGSVELLIAKSEYSQKHLTIHVSENCDTSLNVSLEPLFACVNLSCELPDADIYINQVFHGKGSWKGHLMPGNYIIESRKSGFVPSSMIYTAKAGEEWNGILTAPTPVTGILQVISNMPDAKIYVDGTYKGVAPMNVELLIGKHILSLQKGQFASQNLMVEITEGALVRQNVELEDKRTMAQREMQAQQESVRNKYRLKKGYRGFAFISAGTGLELGTWHGIQFNDYIYVGAGLKYQWDYLYERTISIAPLLDMRIYMTRSKVKLLGSLDIGWSIPLKNKKLSDNNYYTYSGSNCNLGLGLEYKWFAIQLGGSFFVQNYQRYSAVTTIQKIRLLGYFGGFCQVSVNF